ncbi:MAG: hypothetical protein ACKVS7_09735 [Gemmatimonadaceae bacterium]
MTATQLGARSGVAVVVVGIAYAIVLAAGMARHGLSEPIADPILAIMEVLTIASALPLLALFIALHASAEPARQLWGTLSACFAAMFAFATTGVHLVELTSGRATGSHGLVWPSATYAVELFAWDFLLGLALVLAARALPATERARRLRLCLRATGGLCLAGLIGPLVGDMRMQLVGVFGYAVLLPIVAWLLTGWFRALDQRHSLPAA